MDKKDFSFLSKTFLMAGIEEKELSSLTCELKTQTIVCAKGDRIDLALAEEKRMGFVLSGQCEVTCDKLVLNTLNKGDSFGILSIFSDEPYPTSIIAKKACRILLIEKDSLLSLIQESSKIAMNIILFLAGRVRFLSKKATVLGGSSAEEKCAAYLKEEYLKIGSDFPFSATAVARKINVGRASLYRALTCLESKGVIQHKDNSIIILHPELL
jgi:CRP-like cAMP-binding protein